MRHPVPALLLLSLLAGPSACGKLKVVDVPEPSAGEDREAEPATARAARSASSGWASQLAFEACRREIARRWQVSETRVRISTRAHDADTGIDLVNWEVQAGAAGYCRVDERGAVLNVETERSPAPSPSPRELAQDPAPPAEPAPREPPARPADPLDPDAEPREVHPKQLEACRNAVVRETGARPDEVGLSAGAPDERGVVLIDWSLGNGRDGTCLVDSGNAVVQFRR